MSTTKVITKEKFIKASPERVFKALTEKKELETWFVQKANIELQPNGALFIEWAPGIAEKGNVIRVEPNHLFEFSWEAFEPTPTTVTFTLKPEKDGTLLTLHHSGIGEGDTWGDYYTNISAGWDGHLKDLVSWVETGTCPPPGPRG